MNTNNSNNKGQLSSLIIVKGVAYLNKTILVQACCKSEESVSGKNVGKV